MSSKCPKCGAKIKATYFKQNCPDCGVNLLYYKLDEQLEEDAIKAQAEVEAVERVINTVKASTIKTPYHIARLILFFSPLASMCLPMFWAAHKNVSLISFVISIVNHGFDFNALLSDKAYLFSVLSMVCVIIFSLAVIITSLFSSTKKGFRRNIILSAVNTAAFAFWCSAAIFSGANAKSGVLITGAIYAVEAALQYYTASPKNNKRKYACALLIAFCFFFFIGAFITPFEKEGYQYKYVKQQPNSLSVVSFNIAAPWGTPFDDTKSAVREARFEEYMNIVQPDLIATQELNSAWLESLENNMQSYSSYAVKRGGDKSESTSEMNGIFWKKDKFSLIETNTFWLSQTPDKESIFTYNDENVEKQEAGCNRICSYAVLNANKNDLILFMNTHLDNSSEEARDFGAKLILEKIDGLKSRYGDDLIIILAGDFNSSKDSLAYKDLTNVLSDTTDYSKEQGTYQEWGYKVCENTPIDFIFTSEKGKNYKVLDEIPNGYISDHYGIYSQIKYSAK